MQIVIEKKVSAPLHDVWRAWTTPADIMQWNAASADWHTTRAEVDLRPGGSFSSRMEAKDGSMGFDFAGTYTRIVDGKLIECQFGDRMLLVEFIPASDGVTVRETFDAEDTHSVEQQRQGWQAILDNFARHVEAGAKPEQNAAPQQYRIVIAAKAQAIWDGITQPDWTDRYGYGGRVAYDLKAGGRFCHHASESMKAMGMPDEMIVGQVIECEPPRKLVQTWHPLFNEASAAETPTRVTYEINEHAGGLCTLTLSHEVAGAPMVAAMVPGGGDPARGGGGWPWVLSDLKSLLETGKRMPV